jgi:hypothetical protein
MSGMLVVILFTCTSVRVLSMTNERTDSSYFLLFTCGYRLVVIETVETDNPHSCSL